MNTITSKHAEFLRDIRKGLGDLIVKLQDKIIAVRLQCGHDAHDKNCPLCDIYSKAEPESFVDHALPEFARTIDFHLERGPSV